MDTDWALFGYEGQTNTLKLQGTGEDGLIELTEDFNPSKVQYAFLKVEDPKTSLPKFVLINWQGETVPGSRKGSSALHLRDVEKFFVGHHVTMTVRNEDELDMEQIMEKVAKSSSTTYNFKVYHISLYNTSIESKPHRSNSLVKKVLYQNYKSLIRLRVLFGII